MSEIFNIIKVLKLFFSLLLTTHWIESSIYDQDETKKNIYLHLNA